jgi:hypothetical protein
MPLRHTIAGLAAILAGGLAATARAEDAPSWAVEITPYLWAAGISGHVGAVIDAPPTPVDADFPSVFDHLSGFGMVSGSIRYDRFGVLGDIFYLGVAGDHNLQVGNLPALNGRVDLDTVDATLAGFWRAYQSERYTADLVLGGRYTSVKVEARASIGDRGISGGHKIDGWDPIVGARGTMRLGPRGSLSLYGDVGGGSWAKSLWQVKGAYDWRFSSHVRGSIGYRYYVVDLERSDLAYDVTAAGPIFGLSFIF